MACAELPPTPGTQLHAQLLHEVHAPKPKAKRRKRGRGRGARGGGGFAIAGRPTAFSPPGTWSSAPGWGQAPRASLFNARGQSPSTLHWAPPAPLLRTESHIAAAEASGQEACAPAGAVDFFGSNVHRGLRFVRDDDDDDDCGSEHGMEQDKDAAGRKGGDAAGAQARAATAQQEYQALALENQRLSAEVALLRSALLAARQGSAGATTEPPLRDKSETEQHMRVDDEMEPPMRSAAPPLATAPA